MVVGVDVKAARGTRYEHRTLDSVQQTPAIGRIQAVLLHLEHDLRRRRKPIECARQTDLPSHLVGKLHHEANHRVDHTVAQPATSPRPDEGRRHMRRGEIPHAVDWIQCHARLESRFTRGGTQSKVTTERCARNGNPIQIQLKVRVRRRKRLEAVNHSLHHHFPVRAHLPIVLAQRDTLARPLKGQNRIAQVRAKRGMHIVKFLLQGIRPADADQDGNLARKATGVPGKVQCGRERGPIIISPIEKVNGRVEQDDGLLEQVGDLLLHHMDQGGIGVVGPVAEHQIATRSGVVGRSQEGLPCGFDVAAPTGLVCESFGTVCLGCLGCLPPLRISILYLSDCFENLGYIRPAVWCCPQDANCLEVEPFVGEEMMHRRGRIRNGHGAMRRGKRAMVRKCRVSRPSSFGCPESGRGPERRGSWVVLLQTRAREGRGKPIAKAARLRLKTEDFRLLTGGRPAAVGAVVSVL